jgi:AraC-like DNA-binding protein
VPPKAATMETVNAHRQRDAMNQPSILRFSTAAFPERDRLAMFREVFGRSVANMDITPLGEECRADVELHMLPGISVMWGSNSAHRFEKGCDPGKSDDDCLMAWATTSGTFRHLGREMTIDAGPAVLLSCADKAMVENVLPIHHVTLKLPRAALQPLVRGLEDTFMCPIPAENDALQLLKGYLRTVRANHETCSVELQRTMVLHIRDLVALALGATRDAGELAVRRGLAAARLDSMKNYTLVNLHEPSLSVRDVARSQGVTLRYVQALFERDGRTFTSFLLQSRLALAHRRLSDPALAGTPISTIAVACGFGDLSYFNHSFRRTYGETPSDVRKRSRCDRD